MSTSSGSRHRSSRARARAAAARRRRLGRLAYVVGVLLLAVAGGVAWSVVAAREVRSELLAGRAEIGTALRAVGEGDVEGARAPLADAAVHTERAVARSRGLPLALLRPVPLASRSVRTLSGAAEVADAAVGVASAALSQAEGFLNPGGGLDLAVSDGRIDLAPIERAADVFTTLDLGRLQSARDGLAAEATTLVPRPLLDGRHEVLDLADRFLAQLGGARDLVAALPDFLGASGPRRYFLAIQGPGELRGTGGLIGYFAVLRADDGVLSIGEPEVYEAIAGDEERGLEPATDRLGSLGKGDPVPTTEEFVARYGHTAADANFSNVNVDPDLPTTAEVLLDLYEDRTGERLDGVIAVDVLGLAEVLRSVGPLEVPADEIAPGLPSTIAADELAQLTLVDVYEVYGSCCGAHVQRQAYFKAVADAAFDAILGGGWDGVAVGRRLANAASERHLQLYSRDEAEQAAFRALGIGGALAPRRDVVSDLLAVTANNAVGGKQDPHLGYRITGEHTLVLQERAGGPPTSAVRSGELTVELTNPLPRTGMDEYVLGNCLVGLGRYACFEGTPGENRTWLTVWEPEGAQVRAVREGTDEVTLSASPIHGQLGIDRFLTVPSESSASVTVQTETRVELDEDGSDPVYRLTLWHQAKATPDVLDLTFTVPAGGWTIASATVTGGGTGQAMGVFGTGYPVAVVVADDARGVRVTGNVTADVVLELRFHRGILGRTWDWLRAPVL